MPHKKSLLALLFLLALTPLLLAADTPPLKPHAMPVQIDSRPDFAEVWIDGKFVGSTSLNYRLAPGEHKIELVRMRYATWSRTYPSRHKRIVDVAHEVADWIERDLGGRELMAVTHSLGGILVLASSIAIVLLAACAHRAPTTAGCDRFTGSYVLDPASCHDSRGLLQIFGAAKWPDDTVIEPTPIGVLIRVTGGIKLVLEALFLRMKGECVVGSVSRSRCVRAVGRQI